MNRIRKNIIANLVGRGWSGLSVYLFVPLYLKFLGIEAYGLVGFYSTLMGVLAFADMGFTATLNREMARLSVQEDSNDEMRDLLRTYELTYFGVSFLLLSLIWILAPFIAEHWLHSKVLTLQEITVAIQLMGMSIALQLPSGLYVGGLMGLQEQIKANVIQVIWVLFRGLGAVLVLWLFSPTIFAFVLWQLVINAFYCFGARYTLWGVLSVARDMARPLFRLQVFRNTWRYAAGMAGMAVVSILLTQTDKLAVSKMLSLDMLGYYSLAGSLALIPVTLASPIATAIFPRLTGFVSMGDRIGYTRLYHKACDLVAIVIIPAGLTVAIFAGDFIFAWTGSTAAAKQAGLTATFLIAGQIMQAITLVPYYLALANGELKLNLRVGVISVVLITPLLFYFTANFGIEGAGFSWFLMNVCTLPPYMYFLHRRFLPGELKKWCLVSVGQPILVALICVMFAHWLVPQVPSRLLTIIIICSVWIFSFTVTILTSATLRQVCFEYIIKMFGVCHDK